MNDVLALCSGLPEVRVAMGDTLIEEAVRADRLYVLKAGAFEVVRNDVRVTVVNEPGAFLGEISAVLGSAPTASVVAARDSTVSRDPRRVRVGARPPGPHLRHRAAAGPPPDRGDRLPVDIKRQYADSNSHLALMDQVLGNLVAMHPSAIKPGSERPDVPDY